MARVWLASLFILLVVTVPSFAADGSSADGVAINSPVAASRVVPTPASRGALLPALYVSFAALNVYDGASTIHALNHGAFEANPLMSGVVKNQAAVWIVKGGVTAASIVASEHLWRQHHRPAAILLMVATNGVMATVAAHNASVLGGLK